ncbi:hypothetical protein [Pedobacter sp. CFBP9032]|uniref:hypothetical protein n=1 Tax=Pedobacter sp. CFBP9032 TaxID=3096539 RepID=UPI002A69F018|nr:hypothetical protein [Pedobacter sp. CFBP9032]MDY0906602.1 hypothetical protein [Pedobacter sp. CFBP9032]
MERKINQLNENDERIGYWKLSDGDGGIWLEGNYVNGKQDGKWIHRKPKPDNTITETFHNHENETEIFEGKDPLALS